MLRSTRLVFSLEELDRTQVPLAGGKGANLGELTRIPGVRVPAGFCVTTAAFARVIADAESVDDLLNRLEQLQSDDREAIRAISAELRAAIEPVRIPEDLAAEIRRGLSQLGEQQPYAVRSSATAEDLPTASFAGQQDTYLDVVGTEEVLRHVSRCWASLFTERAVTYRIRNHIDHRNVRMAAVVQRMVPARASGVLFTADPVTGNRKVTSVEASVGLAEALVSGQVNADVYKVREGEIFDRTLRQRQPVLTDQQVRRLVQLGRRIEAHFGGPQDIEWCLGDDDFFIVQSRPITTLFPIPAASDNAPHVYLSVSHQQMMTDATRPLGISIRQLTGAANFLEAGGHLWVDVSRMLATPAGRAGLMGMAGKSDPLTGDALRNIIERDFIPLNPDAGGGTGAQMQARGGPTAPPPIPTDPAIPRQLIERAEASIAALKRDIQGKTGPELLDFILADFQELKRVLMDPMNHPVIMAGTEANWWLNDKLFEWLGEKNVADTLTLSVANNVTSEMGLELMEVADVVRHYPDVVELLEQWSGGAGERGSGGAGERAGERWSGRGGDFMDRLGAFSPGGRAAREAIAAWLEKYGMRTVGEIDITRPRWGERPETIIPMILANVRNFAPGAARHRFEQGLREAARKEEEVLARLRALPDGERKAEETKQMIDRVRTFAGYREYPKYAMMSRYYVYKQALMQEADRLLRAGVLRDREDIFYLTFQELQEVAHTRLVDEQLIRRRREEFAANQRLTVPRVLTSEGEAVAGSYRHDDVPAGALVGLAVSAGTVEGRARVVLDLAKADLEPGDILVTAYTDPSWTPLFVGITGLVTEVGGLMTHGSVIAREYGLPAVVAVSHATQHIRDGQRIRLNGTDGYVELLS